jgi:hypothetical protein
MDIPRNLLQHFPDAFRYSQNSKDEERDPSVAFRKKSNTIDWDFEVDTFDSTADQGIIKDNIKAAGALHFIHTLGELCGIFRVTDAIVYQWATGNIDVQNTTSNKLYRYYKFRDERSSSQERHLLYKRVLDRGKTPLLDKMIGNVDYPLLWKKMIYEFVRLIQKEESYSGSNIGLISRKPIYFAIQDLQYNLSASMAGMALIQTQEIYAQFSDCLDILRDPNIVSQKGSGYRRNMWTVIEKVSTEQFNTLPNISSLRTVATEGQKIFKYISEADDSILSQGNALFDDLRTSVDLYVTAMGEREVLENTDRTTNPFQSSPSPLFRNLPGMDNIGGGSDLMGGMQDAMKKAMADMVPVNT